MLFLITIIVAQKYNFPKPLFEVTKSNGLEISIPDTAGLQLFAFHGNINKEIGSSDPGDISGEVFRAINGRWTIKKSNVILLEGDVINYWLYVQANGVSSVKENQRYTFEATPSEENPTTVGNIEEGQLIFNEDFNTLDNSIWFRELKMPLAPDYEFCVFHNDNHQELVTIDKGILRIKPIILEDSYGEDATAFGKLELAGCTSIIPEECVRQAMAYSILPPVISARLNTKNRFSFKYGKIEIRAKFPEGDWIYPELRLEPLHSVYGPKYASGRVILGFARGNDNLVKIDNFTQIFDARKLEFGTIDGSSTIRAVILQQINDRSEQWNKDFHVYTTIWNTDGFQFLVDGERLGQLHRTTLAPYDQEFYISIGVGVGSVRFFPDETMSSGYEKPWKNSGAKPMLQFWNAKNLWLPSWRKENGRKTALEIDYIKVWSE